jgi:hypothetical protein
MSSITALPHGRQRLPDRRPCISFQFECEGLRYTCTFSRFANGELGEVFLANHKNASGADVNARDAAIVASIALQYGAPVEVIQKALCRDSRCRPSGPLATALDLIAAEGDQ